MQQKTSPAATRGGSTRREDGTRRLLNLLFALSVASEPLTTDRIINDPEIGYSGRERESRVKAFNRDRDTLAGLGVYIREAAAYRDAKNEQRRWEIDRRSTHADGTALSPYDAQEAIAAIDQLFSLHAADPARWPLQMARAKLCKIAGIDPEATHVEQGHAAADLAHVWSAFVRRRPATFVYRDARGEERTHIVDLYGMFERGTQVYLVGNDHDANDLRTFRTDRIVSAKRPPAPASRIAFPRSSTSPDSNSSPSISPATIPSKPAFRLRRGAACTRSSSSPGGEAQLRPMNKAPMTGLWTCAISMPRRLLPWSTRTWASGPASPPNLSNGSPRARNRR